MPKMEESVDQFLGMVSGKLEQHYTNAADY
jgi:hypothetical protein